MFNDQRFIPFKQIWLKPLTPMSDQDRILSSQCQYNIKQTSDESNEKYN